MDDYHKTVARRLKRFSPNEARALEEWLEGKPVGINLALQILEQLEDLSKKAGKTPSILLEELLEEVSAKQLTSKELGRRLRDALDRRLHPQRHAHELAFEAWTKRLGLPRGVRVRPPQNFEGRTFCLQVDFSSTEELRELLQAVADGIPAAAAWAELQQF